MPFLLSVLALAAQSASGLTFEVRSGDGLFVTDNGIPVVSGSTVQYYEPGWTHGYYSSSDEGQTVKRTDPDTEEMSFESHDRLAFGTETVHKAGDTLTVEYHFGWRGDHPAQIEVYAAKLWAPALELGTVAGDGAAPVSLKLRAFKKSNDYEERRFGPDASRYSFSTWNGTVSCDSSSPLTLFDARGYIQDWAEASPLLWFGALGLDVAKDKPATLRMEWRFDLGGTPGVKAMELHPGGRQEPRASAPSEEKPVLIPKPKVVALDWGRTIEVADIAPAAASRRSNAGPSISAVTKHRPPESGGDYGTYWHRFLATLRLRFQIPVRAGRPARIPFTAGVGALPLPPGGYRIVIGPREVSVVGRDKEGLEYGLERLAQTAFVRGGRLCLPTGTLKDWPTLKMRGVHLFVGPSAVEFHKKLWTRVLRPLGFNTAVLQCERADWKSLPGTHTSLTTSLRDLARLFAFYRAIGVEPIPLIESFGHAEWLFANGRNVDIAMDTRRPYTLDPRKPRAKELMSKLWDEAIALLHPKTVHFGLDEVDLFGMAHDPALVTELWREQLPFLGEIAQRHGVGMMLWGDEGLAPGEAVDAQNGENPATAKVRREAIPQGAIIGDWHYSSSNDVSAFQRSLKLWKSEGFKPVATTWYEPENIRTFCLAAAAENAGLLQTTWAGYDCSEKMMLAALPQFSAMVLAADYSWSPRADEPTKLGYDPLEVFKAMYFGVPVPLRPSAGTSYAFGPSKNERFGGTLVAVAGTPLRIVSNILPPDERTASVLTLKVDAKATRLYFAASTSFSLQAGDPVAKVTVKFANGRTVEKIVRYAWDVRAENDLGACVYSERKGALCAIPISLGAGPHVVEVVVEPLNPVAGFNVYGVTAIR
jgi:hypothetical protein